MIVRPGLEEYDIYIRSFSPHGNEPPEIGLRRVFGIDAHRARELVLSLPRVVKRRIAAEHVARYERALFELGADYELRLSPLRPKQIAVVGTASANGAREDESGLLTLPPESPSPQAQAPRAAQRFSQTVVGNLDPSTLGHPRAPGSMPPVSTQAMHARTEVSPAPHMTLDAMSSRPFPPAADNQRPSARVPAPASIPPANATREARPSARAAPPSSTTRSMHPRTPAGAQWGNDIPTANGWTAIKPSYPNRPQDAGDLPPPPPEPINLGFGGRPDWLVDGPSSYHESMPADAGPPLSIQPSARPSARPPGMRESPPELVTRRVAPAAYVPPPVQPARTQSQFTTGVAYGQEAGGELPLPLRIGLRIALGAMLFVMIAALRHSRLFDREVDRALAQWGSGTAAAPAEDEPAREHESATGNEALGPIAHDWVESELHVFTNGDKDRVRNLIQRLDQAGATEVHVAKIMRNGMVQIAAELVVLLPADQTKRKAVFGEYEKFLRGTFGDFVAAPKDDGTDVLRIAL